MVTIRLIVDYLDETMEFYLGPAKPSLSITMVFRAGGMHYSATRPIIREETHIARERTRDNNVSEGATQEKKSKQTKGTKTTRSQIGSTKAQRRASARWKRKSMQSQKDKGVVATPSQRSTLAPQ